MRCGGFASGMWFNATLTDLTAGIINTVVGNVCGDDTAYQPQWVAVTAGHQYTIVLTNHNDNPFNLTSYALVDDIATS